MDIKNIGDNILKLSRKINFWSKRKSPEILLVTGIFAAASSVIFAIKATTKLDKTLKQSNQEMLEVKTKLADDNKLASGEYDIKECKKELKKVYAKSIFRIVRLYSPAAISFGLSVASLLGSHRVMKGRNVALAAAYTTLNNGYKSYRERVAKKIGEQAEKDIFRNVYEEEREVIIKDKDGNEKTVTKKIKVPHAAKDSDFSYLFDASNPDWSRHGHINLDHLLCKQQFLNQKLVAQGYLFLKDVYDTLGLEPGMIGDRKMQASRVIGWIYDLNDPNRDCYVSFGISDKQGNLTKESMDLIRNGEKDIWLEFNPDGDILTGANDQATFMKYAKVI